MQGTDLHVAFGTLAFLAWERTSCCISFSCILSPFSSRSLFPLSYLICSLIFFLPRILPWHLFSFVRDEQLSHLGTLIYRRMTDTIRAILFSRTLCYFSLRCCYPSFVPFNFHGARNTFSDWVEQCCFSSGLQWLASGHVVWDLALRKRLSSAFFLGVSDLFPSPGPSCLERNKEWCDVQLAESLLLKGNTSIWRNT